MLPGTAEHFSKLGVGLTSDFNLGGGGVSAEETLHLVRIYFFGKIGGS